MSFAGFGENDGAASDASLARKRERATTWAVILVGVALVMGIAPNWFIGRSFLAMDSFVQLQDAPGRDICMGRYGNSLRWLVTHDVVWACAIATLALPPLWFWWWRRSATAFGGAIGTMLSLAAAVAVIYAVTQTPATFSSSYAHWPSSPVILGTEHVEKNGNHWTLVAAAMLFAIAFLVAPAPRDPESVNALQVRGLVRRHRKTA